MKNTFLPFIIIVGIVAVLISFDKQPHKTKADNEHNHHHHGEHKHEAGNEPKVTDKSAIGGEFHLTNQHGQAIDNSSLIGDYHLVFFGFTHCPAICPTGLANITAALNQMDKSAPTIIPIFITLDGERDTVEKLSNYMKNFHKSFIALTGSLDEIKQAADSYKVYYSIDKHSKGEDYNVNHSAFIYLMDKEGKYKAHFQYDIDPKTLAEKLTTLISNKTK